MRQVIPLIRRKVPLLSMLAGGWVGKEEQDGVLTPSEFVIVFSAPIRASMSVENGTLFRLLPP